jgi:hypothetical protein
MYKMVATYKTSLSRVYDSMYPDWSSFIANNSLIDKCLLIERFKDGLMDWYVKVKGQFPISPRDIVVRLQMKMGENQFWLYGSSIQRPDYPPTPKCVRANMKGIIMNRFTIDMNASYYISRVCRS